MENIASYTLTKILLQRGLALIYLVAFIAVINQFRPLLGEKGLLPVPLFVKQTSFFESPSLFYFFPKDSAFMIVGWIGAALSALTLAGVTERFGTPVSMAAWALLWVLYLSFVNVGQTFYGFGWESILLEAGFLAIFLGGAGARPPTVVIWLFRWLLFRIMFGAGLIKLRGDSCWKDLTCLFYHFETQPMPNPFSWYFHWLPRWMLKGGVAMNHFVELIAPFGYFSPQPFAAVAGLLAIAFQATLMVSGNYAFLSLVTIVIAFSTLDDRLLSKVLHWIPAAAQPPSGAHEAAAYGLALLIAVLSVNPIRNLLSPNQVMNTSYDPLHLVGTYGAFGSITRPRYEVIVEGTTESVITPSTKWSEYEFKGKPGDVMRLPPQVAPYHLRLDWLMWFAGFSTWQEHPWFVHLLAKLLESDRGALSLIRSNPFPDHPPAYVRAELYEYHFTTPEERKKTGAWWTRTLVGPYFPPVSLQDAGFRQLLTSQGWSD